jgi:hypothetical protein
MCMTLRLRPLVLPLGPLCAAARLELLLVLPLEPVLAPVLEEVLVAVEVVHVLLFPEGVPKDEVVAVGDTPVEAVDTAGAAGAEEGAEGGEERGEECG